MRTYILRRLLLAIPTILIVVFLTTLAIRLIPGDAVDVLVGQMDLSGKENREELRKELERELGLDVPFTSSTSDGSETCSCTATWENPYSSAARSRITYSKGSR